MTCEDTMAKITKTKSVPSTETLPTSTEKNVGRKRNKKKKLWKHTVKKEPSKVQSNSKAVLPPKAPQEFSSNWKALQELLKPKTTDLAIPQPTALSSKKPKTQEPKADGSSLGKESSSKVHPICTDKTKEKSKGVGSNKVIAGSEKDSVDQKDKAGTKKKRANGLIENKEKDIQHKKKKLEEKIVKPLTEDDLWFDDVDPEDIEAALGPEAAGLARKKLGLAELKPMEELEKVLVKDKAFDGLTKAVAMDCEMVGVGPLGEDSIVARVSIVNHFGMCIYDKYVKPTEKVTDYRTAVSGIRPNDIKNGVQFSVVQKDVASILEGRILVGHAIHNDLKILFLDHPRKKIRDTQRYKPFKQEVKSGRPSLKLLCSKLLNVKVQTSEHSSVQDAQAAMRLYTLHKRQWEAGIKAKNRAQKQTAKDKPERQSP